MIAHLILPALTTIGAAAVLTALGLAIRFGWLRLQEHRQSRRRFLRRANRWSAQ